MIITSGACGFIPVKIISLQTFKNIFEQLGINKLMYWLLYNNYVIMVMVIISLLVNHG